MDTEGSAAELKLQPVELGIGQLYDTVADAVVVTDLGGRIVLWNRSAEAMFGYPAQHVLGEDIVLIIPERYRPLHRAGLARYRQTGHGRIIDSLKPLELVAVNHGGAEFPIELTLSRIEHHETRARYALAIVRDISERKRVETLQREEIERLKAVMDAQKAIVHHADDLPLLKRKIVGQAQAITLASGSVLELASGAEMVYDVATGSLEPFEGLRFPIEGSLSGRSVRTGQTLLSADTETDPDVDREATRKVGARSLVVVPLMAHDRIVGVLKIVSSEASAFGQREAEALTVMAELMAIALEQATRAHELRERTQQLEAANAQLRQLDQMKDQFISVVSHELRTPINAITGFGSILDDEILGPLSEQQHHYLGKMLAGADTLLSLVNDLLDMSRIQAGKFRLEPTRAEFAEIVRDVLSKLEPLASKKDHRLVNEVPSDLTPMILDPGRISQVLVNLLNNAIKFTPEHGTIRVRAGLRDGSLVCEVQDTGVGIAPEDMDKLFKQFSQLDMSSTRMAGGTGLGLSISKALVEAHGGTIGASSAGPNQGSTFWFTLPLGQEDRGE